MLHHNFKLRAMLLASVVAFGLVSCSDDDEPTPPGQQDLRTKIDYAKVTPTTPYKSLFIDAKGDTTADLKSGTDRYRMFQALNYYLGSAVRDSATLDATVMKNMFANSGNPFKDIKAGAVVVNGNDLNASGVQLRNLTASSRANAETDRKLLEGYFNEMAESSKSVKQTAAKGKAGKLGTYLVTANGIEIAQIIQKGLIGALQLDYIGNVVMDKGLEADNKTLVSGKKYTALEHNWDEAFGLLTPNPIFLEGATDAAKGAKATESFLGSYLWEYNKASYAKIHTAFVKGRVAIVNNDKTELKTQATFIRTEMEKAIASAALGYLAKWKSGTTDAARAHAIGEGLGFIYSLRYCTINGADSDFSDAILLALIGPGSPNQFWDLTNDKVNAASDAITKKFKL
ncbi:DUF4856 domain-containing protein [Dyadobacter endophyticus]|uniref:DUF4856 domain-containing protein n=1 Tax=Dyadobacter endophyticus TaxID=1749036 RepID=A0ABQ1YD14_9BACT|nr:DUF4856 domain-containing protein [Dyadobacter endophyticus]GGH20019.1 DUF4856 domain-containing protein [Dyadobacter endophyticus]